jgi:hypothetical protein
MGDKCKDYRGAAEKLHKTASIYPYFLGDKTKAETAEALADINEENNRFVQPLLHDTFIWGYMTAQSEERARRVEKMTTSERVKRVLHALGFSPKLLVIAMGTTEHKARRILSPAGEIYFNEMCEVIVILRNITPNMLVMGADSVYGKKGVDENGKTTR